MYCASVPVCDIYTYGLSPSGQLGLEPNAVIEKSVFGNNAQGCVGRTHIAEFGPSGRDVDDSHLVIGRPVERNVVRLYV